MGKRFGIYIMVYTGYLPCYVFIVRIENMKHTVILLICLFLFAGWRSAHAQQVALNTNALMWAAMTPNLSCEVVTGERTSLDLSLFGHYKPYGIDSKLMAFQPEFRYWFSGRPMVREFIGVAALATTYNITWNGNVFDGDAVGAGVTFGYALPVRKRFNIQFYGGFGAVYFRQKQHSNSSNYDDYFTAGGRSSKVNSSGYKLMPIKLGISLSYILK